MHVIIGQILNPLEGDELVSVLNLNSVPQRQVQLQLQRTTHHGSPLVSDCTGPSDKRPVLAQHAEQEALVSTENVLPVHGTLEPNPTVRFEKNHEANRLSALAGSA